MKKFCTTHVDLRRSLAIGLTVGTFSLGSMTVANAADEPPYTLARDGFFYVGGKPTRSSTAAPTWRARCTWTSAFRRSRRIPIPIIMVHGGTPLRHDVFRHARRPRRLGAIFRPPGLRGLRRRSAGARTLRLPCRVLRAPAKVPDGDGGQRRYLSQAKYKLWPQAHLHTQWPGSGAADDPSHCR